MNQSIGKNVFGVMSIGRRLAAAFSVLILLLMQACGKVGLQPANSAGE